MEKSIIICGDSFNIGIGCRDLVNEPYGALLGKELNKPVINLAKGSSTNLSIYLQVQYAVDKLSDSADIVLVSNTSYDRVNWFPLDHEHDHRHLPISNLDVNYHQYPPYGPNTYSACSPIEHPMSKDVNYRGTMFTENFRGVIDYWESFRSKDKSSSYYARFNDEPKERTKILYDYAKSIHDPQIDRLHSIGVMTMSHQLLKKNGIKHLMLTDDVLDYGKYMDRENLVYVSWGQLSLDYPDDLPSFHTSKEGHVVAFKSVLEKLKSNGWTQ